MPTIVSLWKLCIFISMKSLHLLVTDLYDVLDPGKLLSNYYPARPYHPMDPMDSDRLDVILAQEERLAIAPKAYCYWRSSKQWMLTFAPAIYVNHLASIW